MKRILIYLLLLITSTACTLLKPTVSVPKVQVSNEQFKSMIDEAASEILAQGWLSDFLTDNNERPIVMVGNFDNSAGVLVDIKSGYKLMEDELIRSGQVRVVSTNEQQRLASPIELVQGISVDYVISSNFENVDESSEANTIFVVSLWGDTNSLPIIVVKRELTSNLIE